MASSRPRWQIFTIPWVLIGLANCSAATSEEPTPDYPPDLGVRTYQQYCLACHQIDGSGVPGMYPPLTDAEWVEADTERLISIVLYGLTGPIEVHGEEYNQVMTPSDFLSDQEVAAVLTYIRSEFGNSAGPVTSAEVANQRRSRVTAQ